MNRKRFLVALLAIVNAVLGFALLAEADPLPPAMAQAPGGGSFLVVTAKPEGFSYNIVWMLDPASDKLFAFYPQAPARRDLVPAEPRTLSKDFAN